MQLKLSEIVSRINNGNTVEERLRLIKKYSSPALKAILGMSFDPNVKFLLPEGVDVPYKPYNYPGAERRLYAEVRRLYLFTGGNPNLKKSRRELLFLQLLESLDRDDAKMLCYVKDKKLNELYPNITYDLVRTAFKDGIAKNWNAPMSTAAKQQKLDRDKSGRFVGNGKGSQ
jgi:hypothetical protein